LLPAKQQLDSASVEIHREWGKAGCSPHEQEGRYLMGRNAFVRRHEEKKRVLGWRARRVALAAAIAALAVGFAAGAGPVRAAFPGANGLIAFQSSRASGNYDIWVMGAGGAARLTTDPAEDYDPAFSPDGSKIAFARYYNHLYVMNADGSGQTDLADGYDPAWTPDGRISYVYGGDIWTMDADGGNQQLSIPDGTHPAWSPDGTKVAFIRGVNLFVATADGSGATQVAAYADDPNWAPDNSKIVFTRWAADPGIAVVKPDGTGFTNLTHDSYDFEPAFSPDGTQIVFTAGDRVAGYESNYELFVMGADGSGITRLTNEFPAYDAQADWQPAPVVPSVDIADTAVTEGDTGTTDATFQVTLSQASTATVTVDYATANGTATTPDDYTQTSGTLTFAAGETAKTVVVPVVGDTLAEPSETFTVTLSTPTNATLGDSEATGTILDDDTPPALPTTSIVDTTVVEGNTGTNDATFQVTLSQASAATVTVDYASADGTATAPDDYTQTSGTLTFAPGETAKTLVVPVVGDTLAEPSETFTVTLSTPVNSTLGDSEATGTILDDDSKLPPAAVSIADARPVKEGDPHGKGSGGDAVFAVRLSTLLTTAVSVDYATADGTATAPADYQAASGTLVFKPGQIQQQIRVHIVDDRVHEPDEMFAVVLSNAVGAEITGGDAIGTIVDDDPVPTADLAVSIGHGQKTGSIPTGGEVRYIVDVSNRAKTAVDAVLTVTLPSGFGFVSTQPSTCTASPGDAGTTVVTCSLRVDPGGGRGGKGGGSVAVRATAATENGGYPVVAAVALAPASQFVDPQPANNVATDLTLVGRIADLALSLRLGPIAPRDGTQTLGVGVRNLGPDSSPAQVMVTLPDGFVFVSARGACTAAGQVITCQLPAITAGSKGGQSLELLLRPPNQPGSYTITGTVVPTGATPAYDPRPSNDTASVIDRINANSPKK
jgi:Calx-beta domain/WD40-like Beta Propeller Repeat